MSFETHKIWNYISKNWSENYYKTCIRRWKDIQTMISKNEDDPKCKCGTRWKDPKFIVNGVCGLCDSYIQPYLSNPKNKTLVEKYISPVYYKYIFLDYKWFMEFDQVVKQLKKIKKYNINVKT